MNGQGASTSMPLIMRLFEKIADCFRKRPMSEESRIDLTDQGLNIIDASDNRMALKWANVKEIVAYKWDLFAYDEICIAFRLSDDDESWLEISERYHGFDDARCAMEEHFAPLPENWFSAVALPAFEENRTSIWRRESS